MTANKMRKFVFLEILEVISKCSSFIKRRFLLSSFMILITVGMNIITPFFFKRIVESISSGASLHIEHASFFLFIYAFSWILSKCSMSLRLYLGYQVMESVSGYVSINILEKYLKQSLSCYVKDSVGKSFAILEKVQGAIPKIFWGYTFYIVPVILEVAGVFSVILYLYGIRYASILVSFIVAYVIYTLHASKGAVRKLKAANTYHSDAYKWLYDIMSNLEFIKCLGDTTFFLERFREKISKRIQEMARSRERMEAIHLFQSMFLGICMFLMLYISLRDLGNGLINLSDVILLNSYILQFVAPLNTLGNIARGIREGKAAISDLNEYLENLVPERQEGKSCSQPGPVNFKNVSYSYPGTQAIENITLEIPHGKITAVIGKTGSGKTTIFKLLLRLIMPDDGIITINKDDIADYNISEYRSLFSVVSQNTCIFNASIQDNIFLGKEIDEDRLRELVRLLNLEKVFKIAREGRNEHLGERGLKLSGGEKQRLTILRALLADAEILLLDEPTSSLDPLTERKVLSVIESFRGKKTVIIITHRASVCEIADNIIVMANGKVEAHGKYNHLKAASPYFSEFVEHERERKTHNLH